MIMCPFCRKTFVYREAYSSRFRFPDHSRDVSMDDGRLVDLWTRRQRFAECEASRKAPPDALVLFASFTGLRSLYPNNEQDARRSMATFDV